MSETSRRTPSAGRVREGIATPNSPVEVVRLTRSSPASARLPPANCSPIPGSIAPSLSAQICSTTVNGGRRLLPPRQRRSPTKTQPGYLQTGLRRSRRSHRSQSPQPARRPSHRPDRPSREPHRRHRQLTSPASGEVLGAGIRRRSNNDEGPESRRIPALSVGILRNYCQQARRTAELAHLLATARASTRGPDARPLPRQNGMLHSVVKLMIEDYEAGASTYELAERYKVRRNTVRDTLRRAGYDLRDRANRVLLAGEGKEDLRRMFTNGASRRELTAMFNVSESTVKRILRDRA